MGEANWQFGYKYYALILRYLPIGDDDEYDWQCDEISERELYDIISKKIASKEQIGINLFYSNGTEGISLMAYNTSRIILSITINRKTIKEKTKIFNKI